MSAAQSCNGDILLQLFSCCDLSTSDLSQAASVCRAWSAPARITLYRSIVFDVDSPRVDQPSSTLYTSSELREAIRHLVYRSHHTAPNPEHVQWLARLPEHSLRTFHLDFRWLSTGNLDILRSPAVRTVPNLILHVLSRTDDTRDVARSLVSNNPYLRTLSLGWGVRTPLGIPSGARLQRLSVYLEVGDYEVELKRVITDPSTRLERFDVYINEQQAEPRGLMAHALMEDLRRSHTRLTLKHLSFLTHDLTRCYEPLVDESLASFPRLETLACSMPVSSPELLLCLPPSVRSVTRIGFGCAQRRGRVFTKAIKDRSASRKQGERWLLESLTVVETTIPSECIVRPILKSYLPEQRTMDALADVCGEAGIVFQWVGGWGDERYCTHGSEGTDCCFAAFFL